MKEASGADGSEDFAFDGASVGWSQSGAVAHLTHLIRRKVAKPLAMVLISVSSSLLRV